MNNNMDFFEGLNLKEELKNTSKYDIEIDGMKKGDMKKLLKSLREEEEYHSDLYYNKNTNEISDYEYDKLKRKILEIEEKYPEFTDKNGVRNRVGGGKVSDLFTKVEHEVPLKSLQDVFSYGEIYDFEKRTRKGLNFKIIEEDDETFKKNSKERNDIEYVVETKIDGLSIALEYNNGKLVRGVTRGDRRSSEKM